MSRPRFSEMLNSRRRQLGLSIDQASRILRLREDVLIAFEEGDFDRMPQSGYAQGMLSSYARYLGLNPRQVSDLFQEELYAYVNGSASHELRRRTRDMQAGRGVRGYDVVNEAGSRPKAYIEYHGLLPTAGGPAGDLGAFATTTPARPRRSMPLAGSGPSAAEAYNTRNQESDMYGQRRHRPYNGSGQSASRERSVVSRGERQRRRNSQRRRYEEDPSKRGVPYDAYPARAGATRGDGYIRDEVSTRAVRPREYSDDMRYDEAANPYERASTINGRRSSRNIARVERPNVRRRSGSDYAPSGRLGSTPQNRRSKSNSNGILVDPQQKLFIGIVLLAVILTAIIVFSVTSCVNNGGGKGESKSPSTNATTQTSQTSNSGSGATSGSAAAINATAQQTSQPTGSNDSEQTSGGQTASTYVPTVVKVSVSAGSYTWLEVTCDGTSDVAESVTGPWEKEYTVIDTLSVQAGTPSAVTVTNNGQAVQFTSKASGLGSLSVKGTKPPETTDAKDGDKAQATDTDSQSAEGAAAVNE